MNVVEKAIPKEIAEELCAEIRKQYRGKWWSVVGLQCWGCVTFTKGDVAKMCLHNAPGHRGCSLVNFRYDRLRDNRRP